MTTISFGRRGAVWAGTAFFVVFLVIAFRIMMTWSVELYHDYARTADEQSLATLYETRPA